MSRSFRAMLLILTAILALVGASSVLAQDGYTLVAWTVDGGGGALSGGNFTLSATVGQPDAGVLQGGAYTLYGGFWWGGAISGSGGNGGGDFENTIFLPSVHTRDANKARAASAPESSVESSVDVGTPTNWLPLVTRPK